MKRPALTAARAIAACSFLLAGWALAAGPAGAQVAPAIAMEPSPAAVGDQVIVRGLSWPANAQVHVELCGNSARRSTPDCDQPGSVLATADGAGRLAVGMTLGTPPVPCPCVIRASGIDSLVTVTLPVAIKGLPTGDPVVTGAVFPDVKRSVEVVSARLTGGDSLLQWLGAAPERTLQLTVRNTGNVDVTDANIVAAAGKGANPTGIVAPPKLGTLKPGEQKTIATTVELGAFSFGSYNVKGEVLGFEPRATFSTSTSSYPLLLIAGALVLAQLALLRVRNRMRARLWRDAEIEEDVPEAITAPTEPLALAAAAVGAAAPVGARLEQIEVVDVDAVPEDEIVIEIEPETEEVAPVAMAMEPHEQDRMASQLASAVVDALRGAPSPSPSPSPLPLPSPSNGEREMSAEPIRAAGVEPARATLPAAAARHPAGPAELGELVHSLQQLASDLVSASTKRVEEFEQAAISIANGAVAARASIEGRSAAALESAMTGYMAARSVLDAVRADADAIVDAAHEQARRLITRAERDALEIIEEARRRAAGLAAEARSAAQVLDVTESEESIDLAFVEEDARLVP